MSQELKMIMSLWMSTSTMATLASRNHNHTSGRWTFWWRWRRSTPRAWRRHTVLDDLHHRISVHVENQTFSGSRISHKNFSALDANANCQNGFSASELLTREWNDRKTNGKLFHRPQYFLWLNSLNSFKRIYKYSAIHFRIRSCCTNVVAFGRLATMKFNCAFVFGWLRRLQFNSNYFWLKINEFTGVAAVTVDSIQRTDEPYPKRSAHGIKCGLWSGCVRAYLFTDCLRRLRR